MYIGVPAWRSPLVRLAQPGAHRQAEVHDQRLAVHADQDVARLDVAVDHARCRARGPARRPPRDEAHELETRSRGPSASRGRRRARRPALFSSAAFGAQVAAQQRFRLAALDPLEHGRSVSPSTRSMT
jgi:hypothetical protein